MPRAEAPAISRSAEVRDVPVRPATVHGWGGGRPAAVTAVRPEALDPERAAAALAASRALPGARAGVIARGMGRAYNDAAQRSGGVVLETSAAKSFTLDRAAGTVTAAAGVTLGELMSELVPLGWMVPVVPGTQHVSVGGAIASDIHGKNHGVDGALGAHVEALGLLTAAGALLELGPEREPDVFAATLGGMGLTGLIVWARIRMRPLSTPLLSVDADRVDDLDAALSALQAPGGRHRVAWLDLLGPRPGRGIVTRAEHLDVVPERGGSEGATVRARAAVPRAWPAGVLRPATVRAFNELRFRLAPRAQRGHVEGIAPHMFPLDGLEAWPRFYGRLGFVQYQLVVPYGQDAVLHEVIARLRASRVPSYLTVLKDLGPAGVGPLSFPIPGWTLTLDLPRAVPGYFALQDAFDELVAGAGGRVYLSKDTRVRPDTLRAMYPHLRDWQVVRDRVDPERVWRSDLALRTGLVPEAA